MNKIIEHKVTEITNDLVGKQIRILNPNGASWLKKGEIYEVTYILSIYGNSATLELKNNYHWAAAPSCFVVLEEVPDLDAMLEALDEKVDRYAEKFMTKQELLAKLEARRAIKRDKRRLRRQVS